MITWNINPIIVHIWGPFAIRWYSLFFLLGFVFGTYAFTSMVKKEGKDPSPYLDTGLFYLIIGTLVGARLGHCFFYEPSYYLTHPLQIFQIWRGGLASHGGYLGCLIALIFLIRKYKELTFFWLSDRVAILALFAGACIRMGNLFNSEIIGRVTDVPWAFIFTRVSPLPRHPTQIYEALAMVVSSLLAYLYYRYYKRKPQEGRILGLCLILACSFRLYIEQFKENQVNFEEDMLFNMGQLLSFPFIALGIFLFFGFHKKLFSRYKNK